MKDKLLFWSTMDVLGHLTTSLSFTDAPGNINGMLAAIFRNLDYRAHIEPHFFGYLPEVSGRSENSEQCKVANNKCSQQLLFLKTGELFKNLLLRMLMLIVFGLTRKFTHIRAVIYQQYVLIRP
jgi:hypothetical protein